MQVISDVLKKYRQEAKLTQMDLANKVNISQCHYSAIENGYASPSLKLFSKLAVILDIDMNILKNADFIN